MSQKLRNKDFEQMKLEDLKKETGFNTLLTFLNNHLAKDNMPDSLIWGPKYFVFLKDFSFHSIHFHLYREFTIADEGLQILT